MWWWEKTIEYMFVRQIMGDNTLAAPLDGKPEKWLGDLVEQVEDKFRLIEFKRTTNASSENGKYGEKHNDYISACNGISNKESAAHWLVFGEEVNGQLKLKYRQYFQNSDKDSLLTQSGLLSAMEFNAFKSYIEKLMGLRGWNEGISSGGLVLAGVGENQVTALSLEEFLHVISSLEQKFQQSHVKTSSSKFKP